MTTNVLNDDQLLASVLGRLQECLDRQINVGEITIGESHPAFIVAEGACNHMCEMSLTHQMIDSAVAAGANAVKFQTYRAERLVREEATSYWQGQQISQLEYYGKLDKFGSKEYEEIFAYARKSGIIAFSTPFDVESASMLHDLGMQLFKIASCDLPDTRLLRHVGRFGKPIILSTGGSTPQEIDRAINTLLDSGVRQLVVMACMLSYPTPNEHANLLRIQSLKSRYPGLIIGYSDHTEPDSNMVIPSVAVVLGARVVEKHYTLDRTFTGSGHSFSTDPEDLKKMIANIRLAESSLGDPTLGVSKLEEAARTNARRSLVAECRISKGQVIDTSMVGLKRPSDGLPGWMIDQVIGKRTNCNIDADQPFSLDMLD
jgi:sialic acid synthase SpsE